MEDKKQRWMHLYRERLPALAKARDPAQKHWPVFLDHCFARIVLDNAVGVDRAWTEVVKSPAVKHMTQPQFDAAIDLAEKLATGEADLVSLDERSLELRGKSGKSLKRKQTQESADKLESMAKPKVKKTRQSAAEISSYFLPSPTQLPGKVESTKPADSEVPSEDLPIPAKDIDMSQELKKIADSNLTPFRKKALSMLCQVPCGRYSTYQAMSDYITKTSHKTCARAVGNAMRNNPFAPEVPCHRILAADGTLGGFGGHWGENGKFANKKHQILHDEGVRFDSKGKVKGPPFRDFNG